MTSNFLMRSFSMIALIAAALLLNSCGYNSMVEMDEEISGQWANVEAAYQERADLIGSLVETVKGSAKFEKSTFKEVTEARSKASSVTIDPSNITPDMLKKFEQAQSGMMSSFSRLLATFERYPDLKSTNAFRDLMSQIEGQENRIRVERIRFNEVVKTYNTYIRKLPNNIFAGIFGFNKSAYFESEEGTDKAPKVNFDDI